MGRVDRLQMKHYAASSLIDKGSSARDNMAHNHFQHPMFHVSLTQYLHATYYLTVNIVPKQRRCR
jgi:hypothetical protein